MKKCVFYLMAIALIVSSCGKSESEFDKELKQAYREMERTLYASALTNDEISSTWRKAIFENKTPSGKYCDDFNEAMKELSDSFAVIGVVDSIKAWTNHLLLLTSEMDEAPKSRKECYDDFVGLVSDVSSFSRLSTNPSGSLKDYQEKTSRMVDNFEKKIDQFKIKYAKLLKD